VVEVVRRTDTHALRLRDPAAATRTVFTGVPAFPVDERWVLEATFQPYVEPRRITVGAVVEGLSHFLTAVGDVTFRVDGQEQRLVAIAGPDGALSLHFPRRHLRREHLPGRANPQGRGPRPRRRADAGLQPRGQPAVRVHRVRHVPAAARGQHADGSRWKRASSCPL
jgi:hypothetical protein